MRFKFLLRRIWRFIWKEDSLLSWVVNVILAFLLVKYIIYPGLGLLLSTSLPVVAVVSGSMEHNGLGFDDWWSRSLWYRDHGFTKPQFKEYPFHNGFNKGDIIILHGSEEINIGDVIVYDTNRFTYPIIHRVIEVNENIRTKGDNNELPDSGVITKDKIKGKAIFRVPFLGWVKIWFTDLLKLVGF